MCLGLSVGLIGAVGCSPALNWRDIRLGSDTRLQFPCKPDRLERQVSLAGRAVPAQMLVCDAGGLTWSASVFDLGDPSRADEALAELRRKLVDNMQGNEGVTESVSLPGATRGISARRSRLTGVRPDGSVADAQALFAARGPRVYQLVVLRSGEGNAPWTPQAAEFLDALRWPN